MVQECEERVSSYITA